MRRWKVDCEYAVRTQVFSASQKRALRVRKMFEYVIKDDYIKSLFFKQCIRKKSINDIKSFAARSFSHCELRLNAFFDHSPGLRHFQKEAFGTANLQNPEPGQRSHFLEAVQKNLEIRFSQVLKTIDTCSTSRPQTGGVQIAGRAYGVPVVHKNQFRAAVHAVNSSHFAMPPFPDYGYTWHPTEAAEITNGL